MGDAVRQMAVEFDRAVDRVITIGSITLHYSREGAWSAVLNGQVVCQSGTMTQAVESILSTCYSHAQLQADGPARTEFDTSARAEYGLAAMREIGGDD